MVDAADFVVNDSVELVADVNCLLRKQAVRADALHGIGHAFDFGDESVVVVGIKPAHVANLSAGIGIERRVIEHDFAALTGKQFVRAEACDWPRGLKPARRIKNRRLIGTTEVVP